mmetsp:Transcript_39015/g.123015  ORF Transcript_39015/g.123015 Transcript_39015/m.123015 type:complete len:84 (-) Transcript_39015:25-276(-)
MCTKFGNFLARHEAGRSQELLAITSRGLIEHGAKYKITPVKVSNECRAWMQHWDSFYLYSLSPTCMPPLVLLILSTSLDARHA